MGVKTIAEREKLKAEKITILVGKTETMVGCVQTLLEE
jgi:hypothetical protein